MELHMAGDTTGTSDWRHDRGRKVSKSELGTTPRREGKPVLHTMCLKPRSAANVTYVAQPRVVQKIERRGCRVGTGWLGKTGVRRSRVGAVESVDMVQGTTSIGRRASMSCSGANEAETKASSNLVELKSAYLHPSSKAHAPVIADSSTAFEFTGRASPHGQARARLGWAG